MTSSSLIIVLLLLALNEQATTQTTAVEGRSTNVVILCDLDRSFHPLYWDIQGLVYDLYSIPKIFGVIGYEAISLQSVDRRMDGWRFQCFTVDLTNPGGLNPGLITILTIFYDTSIEAPSEMDLLQPSVLGRLVLDYQELQVGPVTTTIGLFYSPRPNQPCAMSHYEVAVYTTSQIDNAEFAEFAALTPISTFNTTEQNITIGSHFLKDGANNESYLQVSAVQENGFICATSAYFNRLLYNEPNTRIHVNGTSATFKLPEALRGDRSLQLIWSKDDGTQCVCPPVEQFMSRCACNLHNPESNVVTIADYTITISNLTQEMGEGEVTLYLVSAVSSGCHGACNLRSIARVYQIIISQGYPQPPVYNTSDNIFCFTIPDNPIEAEVYEVNLTDSTGALTRLSGVYSTSSCLSITSDLYPAQCAPFQVSVAATNSVGRETAETSLLPDTAPTPCNCYQEKEKLGFSITTPSTSADISLTCHYSEHRALDFTIAFAIIQTNNSEVTQHIAVPCNSTGVVNSLKPSTNYKTNIVLGERMLMCAIAQNSFTTNPESSNKIIIIVSILMVLSVLLLGTTVAIIIILYCRLSHHFKGTYRIKDPIEENMTLTRPSRSPSCVSIEQKSTQTNSQESCIENPKSL